MSGASKILLVVGAFLVSVVVLLYMYSSYADRKRFAAAANPCERECIQDSGGTDDCRKSCAGHPLTFGPAVLPSSH